MLTMNLFGNKHFIVIDTTNHAVAYVQMQHACTFTMDELAKTLYKCNKIVQSPREFKETFPARSKKHFPDAFVLKNA